MSKELDSAFRSARIEFDRCQETAYRQKLNAYYDGLVAGVRMFAWWKDGVQYVGTVGTPLDQQLAEIEESRRKALADVDVLERMKGPG